MKIKEILKLWSVIKAHELFIYLTILDESARHLGPVWMPNFTNLFMSCKHSLYSTKT